MNLKARLSERRTTVALLAGTLALAALVLVPGAQAATSEGLECETDAHDTFSLTASEGYASTPDGNSIYMWSYAPSTRGFQLPGPTLCVTAGDHVTVILHNTLPEPTSITFPGQRAVKADGKPAQPASFNAMSMFSSKAPES